MEHKNKEIFQTLIPKINILFKICSTVFNTVERKAKLILNGREELHRNVVQFKRLWKICCLIPAKENP
jgi:hypothetical protein